MSKMTQNGSIEMKSRYIVLMFFFWGGGCVAHERDLQQYISVE
jgi:hypothetical protein